MGKSLDCPRCAVSLVESRGARQTGARPGTAGRRRLPRGTRIAARACPLCGGVWLAAGLAERLKQVLADGGPIVLCKLAHGVADVPRDCRGIPCAVCRSPMELAFLERAGIVVDTCRLHGTWFDRGELQQLVAFVTAPGHHDRSAIAVGPNTTGPSPARFATGGVGVAAAVTGGAAAGAIAVAAASTLRGPTDALQAQPLLVDSGSVGGSVLEGAADVASEVVDVGAGEAVAEAGFSLIERIIDVFDF